LPAPGSPGSGLTTITLILEPEKPNSFLGQPIPSTTATIFAKSYEDRAQSPYPKITTVSTVLLSSTTETEVVLPTLRDLGISLESSAVALSSRYPATRLSDGSYLSVFQPRGAVSEIPVAARQRVRGRVVDLDGQPIPGVEVAGTTTAADGTFQAWSGFGVVPGGKAGETHFRYRKAGYVLAPRGGA
jgi:hypothetical protein